MNIEFDRTVMMKPLSGTVDQALWNASRLLLKDPKSALEQAEQVRRALPLNLKAILLSAKAKRACGSIDRAQLDVQRALEISPNNSGAMRELALLSLMRNDRDKARDILNNTVIANKCDAAAWSMLADIHRQSGNLDEADAATRTLISVAERDEECLASGLALCEDRLPDAELLLRLRLTDYPTEVTSIRMMADLATRIGRLNDAEKLLRRCLDIAPYFDSARELLARNLQRMNRPGEALDEVDVILALRPQDSSLQMLKASLLVKIGNQSEARAVYEDVLRRHPKQAKAWMSLGHVLKALGHSQDAISAYKRALAACPTLGEAWWSLANLKTFQFEDKDLVLMSTALQRSEDDEDKLHLHFALGKAQEDGGNYQSAFAHWVEGNSIRRKSLPYDAGNNRRSVQNAIGVLKADVLQRMDGYQGRDPIFVVGMPRSGSTLVEQILDSHSQVEGTMELPHLMEIAARLKLDAERAGRFYPEFLVGLTAAERSKLGEEYLARARIHRKTDRPHFIDKMPNNWEHVGLIRLILPNARIIDTRRHPVGCCLSNWKQHFARGQAFSYDLMDLAQYYADYTTLMTHVDQVAPKLVHRVIYERMVANTEIEVKRLLDYLNLPFEDSCLEFWRNKRAVRTASSEQVRQPIFTEGVDHWEHFKPWLGPLMNELKPVVDEYSNSATLQS